MPTFRYLLTQSLLTAAITGIPAIPLQATWTTPEAISSTTSDQPNIAVDPTGNAVLVWQGYDGSNYIIQSSSYSKIGGWSSTKSLSEAGQDAQGPSLGVDSLGNATVVWSRFDGWSSIIQAAKLPFNGVWSTPVNISDAGQNADSAKIAVDSSGKTNNAVAVWHRYNGLNFIMQGSTLPFNGSWTTPASISVSGQDALVPVVAIDPDGNAAAVCSRFDGSNFTSRAAAYLEGQSWGSSIIISTPGATASQQTIGMDASGNSVIAWSYFNGTNNIIQVSFLHFGDGWTTPIDISSASQDSYIPQVVVDAAGNATALWVSFDGTNYTAQASSLTAGGNWSAPITLSADGGDVSNISLSIDISGNVIAAWDITDGISSIIQSAFKPINGSWSTPINASDISQYAYLPTTGLDSSGNAVAAWLQSEGTTTIVYASTLPFGS